MQTINRTLEDRIREVEQEHLSNTDLFKLERYAGSFANRAKTYNLLRDHAETIVLKSLQHLAKAYPKLIEKQAARCKYDMTNVLRYMALSILLDDELLFKEQIMDWLGTVVCSYQVSTECSMAYRKMQEAIEEKLPPECSVLAKPYTDIVLMILSRD